MNSQKFLSLDQIFLRFDLVSLDFPQEFMKGSEKLCRNVLHSLAKKQREFFDKVILFFNLSFFFLCMSAKYNHVTIKQIEEVFPKNSLQMPGFYS